LTPRKKSSLSSSGAESPLRFEKNFKKMRILFLFFWRGLFRQRACRRLKRGLDEKRAKGGKWWGKLFKRKFSRFVGRVCCVQMMTPMREKGRERAWERERKWWKMIIY